MLLEVNENNQVKKAIMSCALILTSHLNNIYVHKGRRSFQCMYTASNLYAFVNTMALH